MSDHEITMMMIRLGGRFVATLGELWQMGDEVNRRTLKAAFPAYWAQYRDLAERWAAEHPTVTR